MPARQGALSIMAIENFYNVISKIIQDGLVDMYTRYRGEEGPISKILDKARDFDREVRDEEMDRVRTVMPDFENQWRNVSKIYIGHVAQKHARRDPRAKAGMLRETFLQFFERFYTGIVRSPVV